ncbi:hypothetical protein NC652_032679 [Populus alba x Populus x berolinensis]|nr:hypothetical protein NC652_032679 [Populus alba x Populus x berolinensis]
MDAVRSNLDDGLMVKIRGFVQHLNHFGVTQLQHVFFFKYMFVF